MSLTGISTTLKHLLTCIAVRENPSTGYAFPSLKLLETDTGYNRSTITRNLKEAVDLGLLSIERTQSKVGEHVSNHYRILRTSCAEQLDKARCTEQLAALCNHTRCTEHLDLGARCNLKEIFKEKRKKHSPQPPQGERGAFQASLLGDQGKGADTSQAQGQEQKEDSGNNADENAGGSGQKEQPTKKERSTTGQHETVQQSMVPGMGPTVERAPLDENAPDDPETSHVKILFFLHVLWFELQRIDADFERFWKAYPRKIDKKKARASFEKANQDVSYPGITRLLEIIEKLKATPQWQKDNGQFIPYPTTWLNGARWQDIEDLEQPEDLSGEDPYLNTKLFFEKLHPEHKEVWDEMFAHPDLFTDEMRETFCEDMRKLGAKWC
ncbi:MAG: helix-turn-helix domain-containing protein [Desulfovibrionaceae bacterium]|nr:helix-turn-helix domain-containing protein [Desulfovibrionaceae bacterium]